MESAKKSVQLPRTALAALLGLNTLSLLGTAAMGWVWHRDSAQARVSAAAITQAPTEREPASLPVVPGEFITEPFTVTLADSHATHYAKVHITLEPSRPLAGPELERLRPRIRDYVTVLLSSKRLEEIDNFQGKEELRAQIQRGLEKYVERDRLKNVFFSEFVLQ